MSFQLNTATALPAEVQLGKEKPQGAFCLRSRYALSANSASSWNAGTTLSIPLQTGTPGTFTDVKQGIIQATIQISNNNPYVDYLNFGPSGALIFFDEMRIYSSGTPIEENLRYSETADLLTIQGGHQTRPFQLYRRNKWRANNGNAGDKHINFIKPSMVDGLGVPMYGRTPFMDKNSAVYCPPSIQFGRATAVIGSTFGVANNIAGAVDTAGGTGGFGVCAESAPFYDAGINATAASNAVVLIGLTGLLIPTSVLGYPLVGAANGAIADANNANAQGKSYGNTLHRSAMHTQPFAAAATEAAGPPSDHLPYKNTQFGRTADSDANPVVDFPYGLRTAAVYVPSMWPDYQPSTLLGEFDDDEVDALLGKAKMCEYMKYLCNVRNLPVGVRGMQTNGGAAVNYYQQTAKLPVEPTSAVNGPGNSYTQYRVSMPFLSGIYGIFAEKMFPDMLIGANNIRIEFKLAQNTKALWTTMDPCRRVPGTLRDFVPFTGQVSGARASANILQNANLYDGVPRLQDASAGLGCRFAGVYTGTTYRGTSAIAGTEMYNSLSAMGEDFACPQFNVGNRGQTADTAYLNTSMPLPQSALIGGFNYSTVTNLPKPQYIPSSTPWEKQVGGTIALCNENAASYGTYLPASQAQVRRCQMSTRLNASTDNFQNAGQTIFSIRDIQYIGEQVQLDDVVTSAIIQSAATSEIVVWTRGFRSFEASTDNAVQQNIILPIQIGQAESLFLLFRPATITTSYDYYSNAFYCPFVGLTYTQPAATAILPSPDVGGRYEIRSSLDSASQGQFSYQLFSGTKQYPLQPIQTVSEMITEREKSIHALHNWDWCTTENMNLCRWGSKFGATTSEQGLDYDPFIDFGYLTTFVPVYALDDQTITQNPYFQVAEALDVSDTTGVGTLSRKRGIRQASTQNTTTQGGDFTGVLNEFISPIGSFYLGWDFESWTNHQDMMRTGKFLGQEQLSIRMTGTFLCSAMNLQTNNGQVQNANVMCIAIVPHVVKLSFVPGGHLLSYY